MAGTRVMARQSFYASETGDVRAGQELTVSAGIAADLERAGLVAKVGEVEQVEVVTMAETIEAPAGAEPAPVPAEKSELPPLNKAEPFAPLNKDSAGVVVPRRGPGRPRKTESEV